MCRRLGFYSLRGCCLCGLLLLLFLVVWVVGLVLVGLWLVCCLVWFCLPYDCSPPLYFFLVGVCFFVYFWYFRILQSETYEVWDTKFYDIATDNTKESSWYIDTTNTSVSYDGDGRTVTKTDNSQSWRYIFYDSNAITSTKVGNRYAIPIPNIIEFEITAITGSIIFEIRDDNNNSMINQGAIATGHYKIVLDGTDCKMYKDNATTPFASATMNGNNIRFGFMFDNYNESITYKNFKVYPI